MTKIKDMHEKWLRDDDYRREYAALEDEFAILSRRIEDLDAATIDVPAEFDQLDRPTKE